MTGLQARSVPAIENRRRLELSQSQNKIQAGHVSGGTKVMAQSGKGTVTPDWHHLQPQADLPHMQELNAQASCCLFIILS